MIVRSIIKTITALVTLFSILFSFGGDLILRMDDIVFTVDADNTGKIIGNKLSNVNVWSADIIHEGFMLGSSEADCSEFVEYVQVMQATGGNAERDLFVNPNDFTVLDDYDFSKLINVCRRILTTGAKPLIKTGNVPMKYSQSQLSDYGDFGTNIYPPDDYDVYYNYLRACFASLVDEFGRDEVLSWRFGVFTEYENSSWFCVKDENGEPNAAKTFEAFCKIYDYTVAALQSAIGENVFVGAHSMTVGEGLWDERDFIEHCANGINAKTGEKGTRLCSLSASFYDIRPGVFNETNNLPDTISILRKKAESVGLDNLVYGVDEGRILSGNTSGTISSELYMRMCGYTYQAAYDARLLTQMVENDIDYFSSWGYTSNGLSGGFATVSYHVADRFYQMVGMKSAAVKRRGIILQSYQLCKDMSLLPQIDINAVAGVSQDGSTLRLMAYNFKNDLSYDKDRNVRFVVNAPSFGNERVRVTVWTVDDNANYFDEWQQDRVKFGITEADSDWSPDDPTIGSSVTLTSERARKIFTEQLAAKYVECSELVPVEFEAEFENGRLEIDSVLAANTVCFYQIEKG